MSSESEICVGRFCFDGDVLSGLNSIFALGCLPTVDRDRSILAKLLFCFMYLTDEVDEAFSWLWHSLFGPVRELKLPYCPRLPVLLKRWLEMRKMKHGNHTVGFVHIPNVYCVIAIVIHPFKIFLVPSSNPFLFQFSFLSLFCVCVFLFFSFALCLDTDKLNNLMHLSITVF